MAYKAAERLDEELEKEVAELHGRLMMALPVKSEKTGKSEFTPPGAEIRFSRLSSFEITGYVESRMKKSRRKQPEPISVIWEPPEPDERALAAAFRMLFESADEQTDDRPKA